MSSESFGSMFDDLLRLTQQPPPVTPDAISDTPVEGHGSAYDDQIRVRMVNGQVAAFDVQPRALRLDNAELGERLAEAVNTAIADYQASVTRAMAESQTDFAALSQGVREVQAEAMRSIERYTDQMMQMLKQAKPEE